MWRGLGNFIRTSNCGSAASRRSILIRQLLLLLGFSFGAVPSVLAEAHQEALPRFEDFHVEHVYAGAPGKIDLSSDPTARQFPTNLREGIKQGVNFAGEFTIITWGCGTNCSQSAIVHTESGRVSGWFDSCGAEVYKRDSRLLIVNPTHEGDEVNEYPSGCQTDHAFTWDGKHLAPVPDLDTDGLEKALDALKAIDTFARRHLRKGMTPGQVKAAMGRPNSHEKLADRVELWNYGHSQSGTVSYVVAFLDGKAEFYGETNPQWWLDPGVLGSEDFIGGERLRQALRDSQNTPRPDQ
jgi:hypothetical protein